MKKVTPDCRITAEFDLSWRSREACHRDRYVLPKVNLWRDLLPPGLVSQLLTQPVGQQVQMVFPPGELIPAWREEQLHSLHLSQFQGQRRGKERLEPKVGRFYPQGILQTGFLGNPRFSLFFRGRSSHFHLGKTFPPQSSLTSNCQP